MGTHTLSPERTTCLPSRSGLYCDDFGQCMIRLFFRLRCSSRLDLLCEAFMPSEAPKTTRRLSTISFFFPKKYI